MNENRILNVNGIKFVNWNVKTDKLWHTMFLLGDHPYYIEAQKILNKRPKYQTELMLRGYKMNYFEMKEDYKKILNKKYFNRRK